MRSGEVNLTIKLHQVLRVISILILNYKKEIIMMMNMEGKKNKEEKNLMHNYTHTAKAYYSSRGTVGLVGLKKLKYLMI